MAVKTKLFNLDAFEVSLVPIGANRKRFLLTKEQDMDELLKEALAAQFDDDKTVTKAVEDLFSKETITKADDLKGMQGLAKATLKLMKTVSKRLNPNDRDKVLGNLGKLAGITKVGKEGDEDEAAKKLTPEKAFEILKESGDYKVEKVEKEKPMDAEIKAQFVAIRKEYDGKLETVTKENGDLEKSLSDERALRVLKEYEEMTHEMGYAGEHKTRIAKSLQEAKDNLSEDAYKTFEQTCKAAINKENVSELFKEKGSSAAPDNSFEAKVKVAKELVIKANPKFTDAQAESRVMDENPDLYEGYLKENPAQGGY